MLTNPRQSYETTIAFAAQVGLHVYVIPRRSFEDERVPTIDSIVGGPEFKLIRTMDITPAQLPAALSVIMSGSVPTGSPGVPATEEQRLAAALLMASNASNFDFAEYAAYAELIPVEMSPLRLASLGNVLTTVKTAMAIGGAAGAGVKLGLLTAGVAAGAGAIATSPLLVAASGAAGVVVVVAAAAAATEVGRPVGQWVARSLGLANPGTT
jgi:hypothetical protein